MKIVKLEIKKFRKIEDLVVENVGLVNEIYGSNGCGKTSLISFITWMLYGETLDYGKSDDMNIDSFNPYDNISGKITFADENNELYSLARDYGIDEKGKKTNYFFINDRKVKNQAEYYEGVAKLFNMLNINDLKIKGLNIFRAMSDPYYLVSNETQFRELITSLLNVDTYSILFDRADEKYLPIKSDYDKQDKDFTKCNEFYNQQLAEIEKSLTVTNANIDTGKRLKFDEEHYNNLINELKELRNVKRGENQELIDLFKTLSDLQTKLIASKNDDSNKIVKTDDEINFENLKNQYNSLVEVWKKNNAKNNSNQQLRNIVNQKIEALEKELKILQASKFVEIHCPNCNTLINENDYKLFNKNKVEKIKYTKDRIETSKKELESYTIIDLTETESKLEKMQKQMEELKKTIANTPKQVYVSDETKKLVEQYNTCTEQYNTLKEKLDTENTESENQRNNRINEINLEISDLEATKQKIENYKIELQNKEVLLANKSTYETRKQLLVDYRNDEIRLIKEKTTEIFGNDFEFEMLVKNQTTDTYRKCCYASIDGLEHNRANTAKYLKYSIMLLEKLKAYIGGCTMPIIFDIADNIGKSARNDIFNIIKNSQIFYTRIADDDNVAREIKIIK